MPRRRTRVRRRLGGRLGGTPTTNYVVMSAGTTTAFKRKDFSLIAGIDRPFRITKVTMKVTADNQPALLNGRLYDPSGTDSVKSTGLFDVGRDPIRRTIRGTGRIFDGSTPADQVLFAIDNLRPAKSDKQDRSVLAVVVLSIELQREEMQGMSAIKGSHVTVDLDP